VNDSRELELVARSRFLHNERGGVGRMLRNDFYALRRDVIADYLGVPEEDRTLLYG
jgi:hypothetical protein